MTILNENQLIKRLQAQVFMFEEEPVDIVLLADLESLTFMGVTFAGGKRSSTISVPRYYANWLYTNGKARYSQPDLYTQLINGLKQQAPTYKLQELKENLLIETLTLLENYEKNSLFKEYMSEQERTRIQETFFNLSTDRLKKILRDISLNDYRKVEKSLDDLEKPVLKEIFNILTIYFDILNIKDQ